MAGFGTDDLDRLLDLLREDPGRQAQLGMLLYEGVISRLAESVAALADAGRRTDERLAALAEAQGRTEAHLEALTERVDQLAEAQRRTEARLEALTERVDQLAEAQRRTEARLEALAERVDRLAGRVDELAEAQRRTEVRLEALAERVDQLAEDMGQLTRVVGQLIEQVSALTEQLSSLTAHVDWLRGDAIERRYRELPNRYLVRIVRRPQTLTPAELDDLLDEAVARGQLTADEADEIRLADAVVRGRRAGGEGELYAVVEASVGVGLKDVERARRRADLLARTGRETVAVVGGTWIVPDAANAAAAYHVWQVTDGRVVSPAA